MHATTAPRRPTARGKKKKKKIKGKEDREKPRTASTTGIPASRLLPRSDDRSDIAQTRPDDDDDDVTFGECVRACVLLCRRLTRRGRENGGATKTADRGGRPHRRRQWYADD